MKVVRHNDGWILTRMGMELEDVQEFPNLTYFINYSRYYDVEGKTAALFTHLEPGNEKRFSDCAKKVDIAIAMSEKTRQDVLKYRDDCHVIMGGTDCAKPLTFGVVGRTYSSGRKGEYLIENMVKEGYNVLALGEGWPCPIYAPDTTNVKYNTDVREDYYSKIDYLVIPSLIEGGPIPLIDALGLGIPVIAPDVGWAWDFSVIRYERGEWDSLNKVLKGLTPPTWDKWKQDHLELFSEALG